MKITAQQLKNKNERFWYNLLFIISLSPYFNALGWRFSKDLKLNHGSFRLDPQLIKVDQIPDDNLDNISRFLIKQIFRLLPNNQRPITLNVSDKSRRDLLESQGFFPSWPNYPAITSDGMIPLTDDRIIFNPIHE